MKITLSFTPLDKREPKTELEIDVPSIPNIGDTFFMQGNTELVVEKVGWYTTNTDNGLNFEKIIIQLK